MRKKTTKVEARPKESGYFFCSVSGLSVNGAELPHMKIEGLILEGESLGDALRRQGFAGGTLLDALVGEGMKKLPPASSPPATRKRRRS